MRLRDRLPRTGALGRLRRSRPALYGLVIGVGVTAYVAIVLVALYAVLLLPLVLGRAIVAVVENQPLYATAWLGLTLLVIALLSGVVYAVARWAGAEAGEE